MHIILFALLLSVSMQVTHAMNNQSMTTQNTSVNQDVPNYDESVSRILHHFEDCNYPRLPESLSLTLNNPYLRLFDRLCREEDKLSVAAELYLIVPTGQTANRTNELLSAYQRYRELLLQTSQQSASPPTSAPVLGDGVTSAEQPKKWNADVKVTHDEIFITIYENVQN